MILVNTWPLQELQDYYIHCDQSRVSEQATGLIPFIGNPNTIFISV